MTLVYGVFYYGAEEDALEALFSAREEADDFCASKNQEWGGFFPSHYVRELEVK